MVRFRVQYNDIIIMGGVHNIREDSAVWCNRDKNRVEE